MKAYHEFYAHSKSDLSFFEWLVTGGHEEARECSRSGLQELANTFCDSPRRREFEVEFISVAPSIVQLRYKQSGAVVNAPGKAVLDQFLMSQHVFFWDLSGRFYVHRKTSTGYHYSNFLAGEPVFAVGLIATTREGHLNVISPQLDHYQPVLPGIENLVDFFEGQGINREEIKVLKPNFNPIDTETFVELFKH